MKPQNFTTEDTEKKNIRFLKALQPQWFLLLQKNILV